MDEHLNAVSRRRFVICAAGGAVIGAALVANPLKALAVPSSSSKQAEADAAYAQLQSLQSQFEAAEAAYNQAVLEQQEAQTKMDDAQNRIDEATERITDLQEQLGDRARSMYRSGSLSFLDLLLGATTFKAFTSNWDLLNNMNREDANKVSETKELKAEVQAQKEVYQEQERVAHEKADAAATATQEAEAAVSEQQSLYNNLSAEAAELLRQEEEAARAAEAARANSVVQQSASSSVSSGGGSSSPAPSYNSGSSNAAVNRAYAELGKPYVWGGVGPSGYDCSGLVGYCLTGRHERVVTTYSMLGWPTVSDPQPGDVALRSEHTGLYIGDGMMIHAPHTGDVVRIAPVQSSMRIVRCPW